MVYRQGKLVVTGLLAMVVWVGAEQTALAQKKDAFRDARNFLVSEYVEREGITNERVLNSLRQVPRHEFVSAQYRSEAYADTALPIGFQTNDLATVRCRLHDADNRSPA